MSKQCEHIKDDGQQCRGIAIWGSDPPRCTNHRLDGGPRPSRFETGNQLGRLTIKHGYYSREAGGQSTLEKKAARCLLTHGRLRALLNCEGDPRRLPGFAGLYARFLDVAIAYALIAFLGTVALARFLMRSAKTGHKKETVQRKEDNE